jgi:hypothetical protein
VASRSTRESSASLLSQIALAISSGSFAGILPDSARSHLPAAPGKAGAWHFEVLPELDRTVAVSWSPIVAKLRPAVRAIAASMAKVLRS